MQQIVTGCRYLFHDLLGNAREEIKECYLVIHKMIKAPKFLNTFLHFVKLDIYLSLHSGNYKRIIGRDQGHLDMIIYRKVLSSGVLIYTRLISVLLKTSIMSSFQSNLYKTKQTPICDTVLLYISTEMHF